MGRVVALGPRFINSNTYAIGSKFFCCHLCGIANRNRSPHKLSSFGGCRFGRSDEQSERENSVPIDSTLTHFVAGTSRASLRDVAILWQSAQKR
jgi:hypothetical protein